MTESRTLPSRRSEWCRRTPSFFAPSRSMARCERKLNGSVRKATTLHSSVSNACCIKSSLQAGLTAVRCLLRAYHV